LALAITINGTRAQLQIIAATPPEAYSAVKTARRFSPQGLC